MTKATKGIIDNNNMKLNVSYAIVGVVIVIAFTAATALFMSYNTGPPFDYLAFAQEEDNGTIVDTTNTDTNTPNPTNITSSNTTTLVDFLSNVEQIKGHLEQATSNKQAGNNILVLAHTLHPIEEIYSNIKGQLSNANNTLNQTLSSNLNQLSQMASNSTLDQFNMQVQKVNGLLNQTVEKVIPIANRNNTAFNLLVVTDLLSIAETEYEEGVENNTVKEIVEYQDAQGFASRAQSLFEQTSSLSSLSLTKPQEITGNIQKINDSFSELNNAIQNKSNLEAVDRPIRAIIQGITGISEESRLRQPS
jgi:hypothetical protein